MLQVAEDASLRTAELRLSASRYYAAVSSTWRGLLESTWLGPKRSQRHENQTQPRGSYAATCEGIVYPSLSRLTRSGGEADKPGVTHGYDLEGLAFRERLMGETERSSRLEIEKACGRHLGYRAFYRCTSLLSPKETYPIAAYRALEKGVSSSGAITNPLIQSAESSDRTVDFLKWCGRVLGAYHAAVMANLSNSGVRASDCRIFPVSPPLGDRPKTATTVTLPKGRLDHGRPRCMTVQFHSPDSLTLLRPGCPDKE